MRAMIRCLELANSTVSATTALKCVLHVLRVGGERLPKRCAGSRGTVAAVGTACPTPTGWVLFLRLRSAFDGGVEGNEVGWLVVSGS